MNDNSLSINQEKYNKLNDMIIVGEQEVINLKRAKVAEHSEIQRLLKQKKEMEDQIAQFIKDRDGVINELKTLNVEKKSSLKQLGEIKENLAQVVAEKSDVITELNEVKDNIKILEKKRQLIDKESKEVNNEIVKKRANIEKSVSMLNEALNILI